MASFRTLQPGLLNVTRDDGASMVIPMSEQDALAQGLTPETQGGAAPPAIPAPEMANPFSMAKSPDAVAGPGGGPTDLGSGAGVFAQPAAAPDPRVVAQQLLTPMPVSHETAPAATKFDVPLPGERGGAPKTPDLVPVGGGAHGGGRAQSQSAGSEMDPMLANYINNGGGGGGGRPHMGVTSETRKFHESGPVDPALAADIAARQEELDQSTSNQLEDQALHRGDYLEQQAGLQQQQAQNVQAQMQRRQAIDNEITRLNLKSQTAQDELAAAKPKQVDQFWKEKGVGVRIAAAIAMFFGGQQAVRQGGPNTGLEMVNQNIDRWMNDQVQNYNAAKDKAALTNNAYKDALATYGSPELAQTNLQLQALAAKDALIKSTADQIGTQDALGQAQLALQESQLKRKQLQAQAQAQAGADVEAKLTMQGGGGGGGDIFTRIKKAAEAKTGLDYLSGKTGPDGKPLSGGPEVKDARERQIRLPNGEVVWTNSAVKGKELQDVITGNMQALDLGNQMNSILNNGAFSDLDKRRELKGLSTRFLSAVSAAEKQGVVTKADAEQAQATMADPNAILSDGGAGLKATLGAIKGGLQKHVANNTYEDPNATKPYGSAGATSFTPGL